MTVRFLASGAVLLGCTALGMSFASNCKMRVGQLAEFRNALARMEFDIDFLNTTLADSLEKTAKSAEGAVRDVFFYVKTRLGEDRCVEMHELWQRAFERFGPELALTCEDKRILLEFSKSLGCGDREREKNNIRLASMRLQVAEDEARELANRNVKMYRGLGILAGIFIVIVLN